ncbi:hypothetical protein KAFR_0L00840 [Kazachstania africana CBS 2517]|uniref:Purine-cytosine permease n=1 Tax=Kazachstania africana (strain ATCC 22294 / BCRC 22015 / CBS 2517 / CECT 1963 / NBRC 1671 / NRRL Y-8276) TaxID=1071382 RepID=H2B242_KAZAF|nr:hypothetical protein KAFR_0L00840 [Kazachstania africana CBS 2517]CCF60692.1 hypothetical protein KAFR_0L00840 [Kazachstania africana CBS 2517]
MPESEIQDLEKIVGNKHLDGTVSKTEFSSKSESIATEESSLFLHTWISNLNAETHGIDPVTDDLKTDTSVLHPANMWFSANLVLSCLTTGALGPPVYGLNFGASALTIIFFNMIGVLPVAYFSIFGAKLGLRQMVLSRYFMGYWTGRFFSLVNVISCVGWCVLNTICSAQVLNMVNQNGHQCPLWAGCLIILGGTVLVTFFGYKVIHNYERWSWIPNFAIFLILIARMKMSGNFTNGDWTSGPTTAGNVLSFGCAVYGYAAAWATYAADYTVYMPRNTSKMKIFIFLYMGLFIALVFSMMLGAALAMGTYTDSIWSEYYNNNGIGGLIYCVLVRKSLHGFGEFCCVVFALSTIANNCPNMYTIALSVQATWEPLAKLPRAFWTVAGNCAALAIAIPACYYYESFLEYFMNTVAYYSAIYISLGLAEHFIFRRNDFRNYNIEDWNNPSKLPLGIASAIALFVGAFGVALGMNETFWTGEIGRLIGENGGDIGLELGGSWAFIVYVAVRPLELKYVGR